MSKAKKTKSSQKPAAKTPKAQAIKSKGDAKAKRVSALDAAAQVLKAARKPMRAQELIAMMAEQSLWSSPQGKTPHATLYAAMLREIKAKGGNARFARTDHGMFTSNKEGK